MDKYTAQFLRIKRQDWKKSFVDLIKGTNNVNTAIRGVIDKNLYYSKSVPQLSGRIRKVLNSMGRQMENMTTTRKDLDKKKVKKIQKIINKARKDIGKIKG